MSTPLSDLDNLQLQERIHDCCLAIIIICQDIQMCAVAQQPVILPFLTLIANPGAESCLIIIPKRWQQSTRPHNGRQQRPLYLRLDLHAMLVSLARKLYH